MLASENDFKYEKNALNFISYDLRLKISYFRLSIFPIEQLFILKKVNFTKNNKEIF